MGFSRRIFGKFSEQRVTFPLSCRGETQKRKFYSSLNSNYDNFSVSSAFKMLKFKFKVARVKFNIFIFIFSYQGTMKQTVKHSVWIEYEKSWKHLFHLLQVLQAIILEICEIPPNNNRTMTFCGTFRKNIARIKV